MRCERRPRARACAAAVVAVLAFAVCGTLTVGCAGPPWYMGQPLSGAPSIPETTQDPSVTALRRRVDASVRDGRRFDELADLLRLHKADRLQDAEVRRLAGLLVERARAFADLGRAVPRSDDLELAETLAPGSVPQAVRAAAWRDAGDAWLALGVFTRARAAFDAAARLGAADVEARHLAARQEAPTATVSMAEIEDALASVPVAARLPFAQAYLARGGASPSALALARETARWARRAALLRLLDAHIDALGLRGTVGPTLFESRWDEPRGCAGQPPPVAADVRRGVLAACVALPWLVHDDEALRDEGRSAGAIEAMLTEDPANPRVLALAARHAGLAGRPSTTELHLADFVFYSPDRRAALAEAAAIWTEVGQSRQACGAWARAARWLDEPDDPLWARVVACTRRDPGAGNHREVLRYVLDRLPPERRAEAQVRLLRAADEAGASMN